MLPLMRFTSVRNVRSIVLNGVSCAPKFTVRGFAKYQELPNMVQPDDDPYFDASTMAVPWLRDSIRIEMYKKNKEDPKLWSAKNLSQHYKASYDRVVAVLTLLQLREKTITDDGFKFDLSTGEPVIPTKWQEVYDLSKSDKALNFSEIATACDMEGKGSDVKDIITRMKLHEIRAANLADHEEEMEEMMIEYDDVGVDVSSYRENPKKRDDRWAFSYFPKMLRDEDVATETARLMKNIINETRAVIVKDTQYYVKKHSLPLTKPWVEATDNIVDTATATAADGSSEGEVEKAREPTLWNSENTSAKPVHDHSKVTNFRRTKLAFRDTSYQNYMGSKGDVFDKEEEFDAIKLAAPKAYKPYVAVKRDRHDWACPPPTMILTRGGAWRRANAYEESQRSWTTHPTYTDLTSPMNKVKVAYLSTDWDGDEALVKAQEKRKNDKKKALLATVGVKFYTNEKMKK